MGAIDPGGVLEHGVKDGKGMLYVVMQDTQGSVTAVDTQFREEVVDRIGGNPSMEDRKPVELPLEEHYNISQLAKQSPSVWTTPRE